MQPTQHTIAIRSVWYNLTAHQPWQLELSSHERIIGVTHANNLAWVYIAWETTNTVTPQM